MEILTEKQKENRAYHAKNSEAIREKKRQQYQQRKASKEKNQQTPFRVRNRPGKAAPFVVVSDIKKSETRIRRQIEDILIERQINNEDGY